jgi:hypothetical protein
MEGLPEPVADAVARVVETLRKHLSAHPQPRRRVELLVRDGTVLTPLTREEIYRDVR